MRWSKSSPSGFGMALPRSGWSGLQSEERRCVREEGGGGYGRAYAGVLAVNGEEIVLESGGDPGPS